MESIFCCPLCHSPLTVEEKTYRCRRGHAFDQAKEGYVYLLPVNQKHSKMPGDDKAMAQARNRFLSYGYYAPLKKDLMDLAQTMGGTRVLDSGCGEGYYTAGLLEALPRAKLGGIDISKPSARLAAKKVQGGEIAVASAYHLPILDGSLDLVVNCFSPLAIEELQRVLCPGGGFLYVVPGKDHLWEMKEVLYEKPYRNEEQTICYEGFTLESVTPVDLSVTLPGDHLWELFAMTPYFWKTPKAGAERLRALAELPMTLSFRIHAFRRG